MFYGTLGIFMAKILQKNFFYKNKWPKFAAEHKQRETTLKNLIIYDT